MKLHSFFQTILILLLSNSLFGQNSVEVALKNFANSPEFSNATITFYASSLSNGDKIAGLNENYSVPTASTAKLFSTATALEILGKDYRAETKIFMDGQISKEGVLTGNIWIKGGGDPTLGSKYFTTPGHQSDFLTQWVDSLKKLGVKSISGAIIADGSAFGYAGIPDGWNWGDMGNYYGAGPSGICIYDNMLNYYFKTGATPGSLSSLNSTFPTVPNFSFHNYVKAEKVSGDNSYIYGGPYSLDRFASGSLPLSQSNFEVKGSIPDPEFQLAYELANALVKNGIQVNEGPKSVRQLDIDTKNKYNDGFRLLFTHKGEKLIDIITLTNMKSINLFAEQFICLVGYHLTGNGSTEEGLSQLEKYWKSKFSIEGLYLKDGSGLSRSNGISAVHFCSLLTNMNKSVNAISFQNSLPIAGKSGTLYSLCKDQAGHGRIIAKSGTMSRIKSYSGYVHSKSGKQIAFSFTVNNFNCSSSTVVDKMEKVLNALAVY